MKLLATVAARLALVVSLTFGTTVVAPAADAPPVVLAADTPTATSGATFTAPKSWSLRRGTSVSVVTAPEGDLSAAIVDVGPAADAAAAVARAWQIYRPAANRKVQLTTPLPARNGWDAGSAVAYDVPPNEHLVVQAVALRHGNAWTVMIVEGNEATAEKRSGAVALVGQSLRPAGYTREQFTGRVAHRLDPARVAELTSFIQTSMQELHVPGVAIALMDHGRIVFEGGFGVRDTTTNLPVDKNTLFMVASNTKGMTTLLLSELVDQGKLTWDEKVVDVYPAFRLGSADTTKNVRIKDLICACTGVPRNDYEWILDTPPNTQPVATFDFLAKTAPTSKFGEVFQYNNLMATAAGLIAGHLEYPNLELGAAYDEAMQTMVFDPLGMHDTTFDMARALAGDHASAYGLDVDGNTKPDDMGINNVIAPYRPAGGAWSSAHDFINYVQNELTLGMLPNGKRLVSEKNLLQRRVPTVPIGETATYGMGLMVDTTYGIPVVHHGGDLIGYHSDWFAIPDAQVGALIFTNADQGVYIRGPFMRRLLEVLYDGRPEAAADVAASAKTLYARVAAERSRLTIPAAPDAAAQLAAHYRSPDLGHIDVLHDAGGVVFDFGAFKSHVASQKNDDGTTSFIAIDPGSAGFEFVLGTGATKTLTVRDGQHVYVYQPVT
ncbi:MAG TPA: serine hydrolase domain-containing protein [Candidatus Elarobacter sp.]|nr:serine hydrolase domain-containing protein [Candidatus Elarobacter sp.]